MFAEPREQVHADVALADAAKAIARAYLYCEMRSMVLASAAG